jgi:hypothetical protein
MGGFAQMCYGVSGRRTLQAGEAIIAGQSRPPSIKCRSISAIPQFRPLGRPYSLQGRVGPKPVRGRNRQISLDWSQS